MMAITVIMIIKWHWRLDAFKPTLIIALGVTLGICSCVTRMMQISGSTRLVLEVLCTFRPQLYRDCDIAAVFFFHQGQPLAQGLIIVMTWSQMWHSSCGALDTPKIGGNQCRPICHLATEYQCFLQLAA
jgi:hypothetical protein